MLKYRVIPTMLLKDFGLVKGISFDSWRRIGPLMPSLKVYNSRDVDELILVDIRASLESSCVDDDCISDSSLECSVPFTVGGGVSSVADVRRLLSLGADKVCINTALYENPTLIDDVVNRFGSQCLVASVDVRNIDGRYVCFGYSGTVNTGIDAIEWCVSVAAKGVGEILLTSIDRDGTMTGYDLELLKSVTSAVKVPVIASGGAGNYQHMIDAILIGGASAVAAASIFHFTELTPIGAKIALREAGIPVRNI